MDEIQSDENFVSAVTLDNEVEAALFDSLLNEEKIPHLMQSYHDTALDGIYQMQRGWGRVNAPQRCKQRIVELLEAMRAEVPPSDPATETS